MANKVQILDKIERNMKQRGYGSSVTRTSAESLDVAGLTVSYVEKDVSSPMGGVDDTQSPFLGVGTAAPGALKIKGDAGENTLAAVLGDAVDAVLLAECAGKANDIIVEAGDTTAELVRIAGHADVLGLGE